MTQAALTQSQSTPKSGENSGLWLLKLVTGPFILVVIAVHLVANHLFAATSLLSYNQIISYYQVWIVPVMEALFLALVIVHSLLGLRSVLLDLHPGRGQVTLMNWAFIVIGIVSFVYGLWLIRAIVQAGIGA